MFYRKSPKEQQDDLDRQPTEFETQYSSTPTCFEVQEKWRLPCDQFCAVVCARKHENGLSLREVADRMGVSFPRISQIEHAAFKKLKEAGVFQEE